MWRNCETGHAAGAQPGLHLLLTMKILQRVQGFAELKQMQSCFGFTQGVPVGVNGAVFGPNSIASVPRAGIDPTERILP